MSRKRKAARSNLAKAPAKRPRASSGQDGENVGVALTHVSQMPAHLRKFWHKRHTLFTLFDEVPPWQEGSERVSHTGEGEPPNALADDDGLDNDEYGACGVVLDEESWYSVTPEAIAAWTAERCYQALLARHARLPRDAVLNPGGGGLTMLDAFCGAGGNAIQFAMVFDKVIAIDVDPIKLAMARHNARIYGVHHRIRFVLGDFFHWARQSRQRRRERKEHSEHIAQTTDGPDMTGTGTGVDEPWMRETDSEIDAVFMSPPWGGVGYMDPESLAAHGSTGTDQLAKQGTPAKAGSAQRDLGPYAYYPLTRLCAPSGGQAMLDAAFSISPNVAVFLPKNVNLREAVHAARRAAASSGADASGAEEEAPISQPAATPAGSSTSSTLSLEVEENWMEERLKALTLYSGALCRIRSSVE